MRRQFDNKAWICEASGDYLSAATIRGRRLIEEIRYLFFFQASATLNARRRGCVYIAAGSRIDFVVESYSEVSTLL